MIVGSICTVLLSYFSTYVAEKRIKELTDRLEECVRVVILAMSFIFVIIMVAAQEIITLLYGRGAFDIDDVNITAKVFAIYGIGLVFIGIRDVLIRTHYAFQKNKTAMINGLIGMLANIVLSIWLSRYWGVYGIAIATVVSYFIIMSISIYTIKEEIEEINKRSICKLLIQIIVIIAVIIVINYLLSFVINEYHYIAKLCIKGVVVCFIYGLLLYLFKNDEIRKGVDICIGLVKRNARR